MTNKHSDLPWRFCETSSEGEYIFYDPQTRKYILVVRGSEADARFIDCACNHHDELVEALRFYADLDNNYEDNIPGNWISSGPESDEFQPDAGYIARKALGELNLDWDKLDTEGNDGK
jgi:hypothetical protein